MVSARLSKESPTFSKGGVRQLPINNLVGSISNLEGLPIVVDGFGCDVGDGAAAAARGSVGERAASHADEVDVELLLMSFDNIFTAHLNRSASDLIGAESLLQRPPFQPLSEPHPSTQILSDDGDTLQNRLKYYF